MLWYSGRKSVFTSPVPLEEERRVELKPVGETWSVRGPRPLPAAVLAVNAAGACELWVSGGVNVVP